MGCGINGTGVVMERAITSPDRHCLHCPCASPVGQRHAEGDSCPGQSAKHKPAFQLATEHCGCLTPLVFTF